MVGEGLKRTERQRKDLRNAAGGEDGDVFDPYLSTGREVCEGDTRL
jgi:hypothetical protein